jgi:hypothetical protein
MFSDGFQIAVTYQVLDQRNMPILSSHMIAWEMDLNFSSEGEPPVNPDPNWFPVQGGTSPITGSLGIYTTPRGTFRDAPFGLCSPYPSVRGAVSTQPRSITVGASTNHYAIRTNHFFLFAGVSCFTGQVTNNADINFSR